MTRLPGSRAVRSARQWVMQRLRPARDGGFILLESMIAITVITVVMGAVSAEFVGGMVSAEHQRAQQGAVRLASSAVEQIRALHPSDLVTGRDQTSVGDQLTRAGVSVQPWLRPSTGDPASDVSAARGSGASAAVPTSGVVSRPGSVAYTVNEYLSRCSIRVTGSSDCVATTTLNSVPSTPYLRAVVAVTWTGPRCDTSAQCLYVTSTLVSAAADPTFETNAAPQSAPVVVEPGDLVYAIEDDVNLQLAVRNLTGVPPYTWAVVSGTLPTGLSMDASGLVAGTVQGPAGPYSVTVRVTDAFLRTDDAVLSWTVKEALRYDQQPARASTTGEAISRTLVATGGQGAPYTFTDPDASLPAGLTITAAGLISGAPTTVGTSTVRIRLTAKSGKPYTQPFTWTVTQPPLAASIPATQTSTVGTPVSPLVLNASGGTGTYAWRDATPRSLPAGLTLDAGTGRVTGTPTGIGQSTVTVTVTSGLTSTTVSFRWDVVARPTVTSPGNKVTSVGSPISLQLTTTCPNTPCQYTFGGSAPNGLTITAAGLITGTVGTPTSTFAGVTVVVTDAAGAQATTAPFTWTVLGAPTIASPGNQVTSAEGLVGLQLTTTCPNTGCSYAFVGGTPVGLTISGTGLISGTIKVPVKTYENLTIVVTDAGGAKATTAPFSWIVNNTPTMVTPGDQFTLRGNPVSLGLAPLAAGGTGSFTFFATGLPTWLTLNTASGLITGTAPNGATSVVAGITVGVRDASNVTATSSAFSWTVSTWANSFADQTTYESTPVTLDLDTFSSGGNPAFTYAATGALPAGLSLNGSTGVISGTTANVTGSVRSGPITVTATDKKGSTLTLKPIYWYVTDMAWTLPPPATTPRGFRADGNYAASYVRGGATGKTYTASPLPTGLVMSPSGAVTGLTNTPGVWTVVLTVTDGVGAVVVTSFRWTVS